MQKHFNLLIILLSISFACFLIEIQDLLLYYEIFIDIILILSLYGAVGLFIVTIIQIKNKRQLPKAISIIFFIILIGLYIFIYAIRNDMFAGNKYLDAVFLDDRSRMDLTLYDNGKFVIFSNGMLGEVRFDGYYKLHGNTIIFDKFPVIDNDIISKEIIIDRTKNKIYFRKDKDGKYDQSFYYFEIDQ